MTRRINFRNGEASEHLKQYVEEHVEKIEHALSLRGRDPIKIEMIITFGPIHAHHRAEIRIHAAEYHIIAHDEGPDYYKTIDRATDKALTEFHSIKERWDSHNKKGCDKECKARNNARE
jgi:ribosomal subunit interface protein